MSIRWIGRATGAGRRVDAGLISREKLLCFSNDGLNERPPALPLTRSLAANNGLPSITARTPAVGPHAAAAAAAATHTRHASFLHLDRFHLICVTHFVYLRWFLHLDEILPLSEARRGIYLPTLSMVRKLEIYRICSSKTLQGE